VYKWFFAWRYLHTKLIALFGVASVTLCVAMVLVVLSVMGGFLDTVRERSRGLHSEIVLSGRSMQGFPFYEEFEGYLAEHLPHVVRATTPEIYSYGIFRVKDTPFTKMCQVMGIRLQDYVKVNDFGNGLNYDHYYPGTTHLGLQQMPVAAFSDVDTFLLPKDYMEANARWRNRETDPQKIDAFDRRPFQPAMYPFQTVPVPGERVFVLDSSTPRYEGTERYGVIVGSDLLFQRNAAGKFERDLARGAEVVVAVLPISATGNPMGEPPVKIPLRYADDSRTGIYEIDNVSVYVDFDMLQKRLAMDPQPLVDGSMTPQRANQLMIGLQPGVDLYEAKEVIAAAWDTFCDSLRLTKLDESLIAEADVLTWEDLQRPFINAVEKEKVLVTFLFSLISVVAIVLLGCIFYMIVEKKTRDIGTLKALGASARGVASIFISYAFVIGIVGSILGTIVGCLFVWNINTIQDWLAALHPQLRVWSPDVYSFDKIPEVVKSVDALCVGSIAVVSSIVGSLIPSYLASRVWPVQALRYE